MFIASCCLTLSRSHNSVTRKMYILWIYYIILMDYTIFLTTEHLIILAFKQYKILISGKN